MTDPVALLEALCEQGINRTNLTLHASYVTPRTLQLARRYGVTVRVDLSLNGSSYLMCDPEPWPPEITLKPLTPYEWPDE